MDEVFIGRGKSISIRDSLSVFGMADGTITGCWWFFIYFPFQMELFCWKFSKFYYDSMSKFEELVVFAVFLTSFSWYS